MKKIANAIKNYEDFEKLNLESQHAIWEVHSVKLMGLFIGLLISTIFPKVLEVHWIWYALGTVVFAVFPGIMAVRRINASKRNK